jgi:hypothetical protein
VHANAPERVPAAAKQRRWRARPHPGVVGLMATSRPAFTRAHESSRGSSAAVSVLARARHDAYPALTVYARRLEIVVLGALLALAGGCKNKGKKGDPDAPDEGSAKAGGKSKKSVSSSSDPEDPRDEAGDPPGRNRNAKDLEYLTVDGERCSRTGKREHQVDVNQDGYADLVTLYVNEAGSEKLACKQGDLNFDGRLDAFVYYEASGEVSREQFDQDYDGRIDMGRYYAEGKLVRDELDLNADGFADSWRIYDDGRLVRVESDRDADGRADMFTYYMGKQIDRIGYDVNGDGKVDTWDHDAARRARLALQKRQVNVDTGKTDEELYVDEGKPEEGKPDDKKAQKPGEGKKNKKDEAKKDEAKKDEAKSK